METAHNVACELKSVLGHWEDVLNEEKCIGYNDVRIYQKAGAGGY